METKYLREQLLNYVTGKESRRNKTYVGFSTTTPNEDGSGVTEPKVFQSENTTYTRLAISYDNWSDIQSSGSSSSTETTEQLKFNETYNVNYKHNVPWGTCTHVCIWDSQSSGNLLFYSEIPGGIKPGGTSTESNPTVPVIRIGDLKLTLTSTTV